jgi:hypothetical protein
LQIFELTGVSANSDNSRTTVVRSKTRAPEVLAAGAATTFYSGDGWYLGRVSHKDISNDALLIKAGSVDFRTDGNVIPYARCYVGHLEPPSGKVVTLSYAAAVLAKFLSPAFDGITDTVG